ncbi:MAG: TetR/AcrR family transcriptional regulator [Desulfobacter sp.]|nr:TetR/AcrR family transcriptional regulator [Desulfobacter sp.]WDP84292.1 MAG: TetR/AcrR family transcriptional regulator [Desulfobacter sp.]
MPRITRNPEEIEKTKNKILDAALAILFEEGFDDLSMRKLGRKLGMTAPNIYNYYSSKDELYLVIQTIGFERICQRFEKITSMHTLPIHQFSALVDAYLAFGMSNPDYYSIMFSRNTPKYTDYIGTKLEPIAFKEKKAALKVADLVTSVIRRLARENSRIQEQDAAYHTIQVWTSLHGIVSLYYTRVLQELDENVEMTINRLKSDMVQSFGPEKTVT